MKLFLIMWICAAVLVAGALFSLPATAQTTWVGVMWSPPALTWTDSDVVGVVTFDEDNFNIVEYTKNSGGKYRPSGSVMTGTYQDDVFSGTYTLPDGSWTFMTGTFGNGIWNMTDSEGTTYWGFYTVLG